MTLSAAVPTIRWIRTIGSLGSRSYAVGTGAALCCLLAAAIHQIWLVGDFRVDDAYITFSFSKNLASGHGPIYSHDLCVEGYSNFLWMVMAAGGLFLAPFSDPYWIARAWGLLALAATCFLVYRAVFRVSGHWAGLLAAALITCCSDLFRAALSGLETAAFVSAFTLGWYLYLRERWPNWKWTTLAFVPMALIRIDGFVPVVAAICFEFLLALYEKRFSYSRLFRWCAPFGIAWVTYFIWRWRYYGLLLPTTYYAKSLATVQDPLRGYHLFQWFWDDYGLVAIAPLVLGALTWGPRYKVLALAFAAVWQVAYSVHVGGDWMPFHRFLLPVVPLIAILSGWGIERIWVRVRSWGRLFRWLVRLSALASLGWVGLRMHAASIDTPGERAKLEGAKQTAMHTRRNLLGSVDLLKHVVRNPGERLATDYAGVFAYYTDAEVIDMWGLCNEDIALHGSAEGINPEYGKSCPQCYAQLLPDYFHVIVPIVRAPNSFASTQQVLNEVFQGHAIDRVIEIRKNYATGRVMESATQRTLWFLERRRSSRPLARRDVATGIFVDYPFE